MTHVAYKGEGRRISQVWRAAWSAWVLGTIAAAQGVLKDNRVRPIAIYGPRLAVPDVPQLARARAFADPGTLLAPKAPSPSAAGRRVGGDHPTPRP